MAESGKTERATPKKREDERKKGNIFQSRDVTNALSFVIILFVFKLVIKYVMAFLKTQIVNGINRIPNIDNLTTQSAVDLIKSTIISLMILIVPVGAGIAIIVITLTGIQTKFMFNGKKLKPQFSRIDLVSGLKRMFSLRSYVDLLKSLIKVTIIASVVYNKINNASKEALKLPYTNLKTTMGWMGDTIYDIAIGISIYLAIFAAADYLYQWWEYERDIMMTKQEIKDEYKQTEGDPQIKSRIKDIQRKLAAMRMMKKVPNANVVIRNPTHYAVALKYKPPNDKAPVVIAKGKDLIALKIIQIAEQNNVHITENRPLARGLYEAVQLDRPIPEEFYKPVADILAFIYKLRKNKKESS